MSNFTRSILYSTTVLVAGLVAIFSIYNNVTTSQNGTSVAEITPAAGGQQSLIDAATAQAMQSMQDVIIETGMADDMASSLNDIETSGGAQSVIDDAKKKITAAQKAANNTALDKKMFDAAKHVKTPEDSEDLIKQLEINASASSSSNDYKSATKGAQKIQNNVIKEILNTVNQGSQASLKEAQKALSDAKKEAAAAGGALDSAEATFNTAQQTYDSAIRAATDAQKLADSNPDDTDLAAAVADALREQTNAATKLKNATTALDAATKAQEDLLAKAAAG